MVVVVVEEEEELDGMMDQVVMGMGDESNSVTVREKDRDEKVISIEGSNHLYGLDSMEFVGIVFGNLLRKMNIVHLDIVDRKEQVKEVTSVVKLPIFVLERHGHLLEHHFEGHMTGDTQWTEDVVEQADTMMHVVHEKPMNVKNTSIGNALNVLLVIVVPHPIQSRPRAAEEIAEVVCWDDSFVNDFVYDKSDPGETTIEEQPLILELSVVMVSTVVSPTLLFPVTNSRLDLHAA